MSTLPRPCSDDAPSTCDSPPAVHLGRALTIGVALTLASLFPAPAWAFTAYEAFAEEPTSGGGGGRFFTGSPRDGFTCAVCHVSERPVTAPTFAEQTLELLEQGYVPGQTYDLILELDTVGDAHAGVIEVTDETGAPVGALSVPDIRDPELDECQVDGMIVPAVYLQGEDQGRQVAVSDSCGEGRVYVQWTAPAMPVNGLRLYAAAVIGDGDTLPRPDPNPDPGVTPGDGDQVQVAVLQLPVAGDAPNGTRVGNACATGPGPSRSHWAGLLVAGAALLAARRRR